VLVASMVLLKFAWHILMVFGTSQVRFVARQVEQLAWCCKR
jgi:hypothetical protein